MTTNETTYNGWKNYETWCVHLWLSNDEPTYRACRQIARECKAGAPDHANTQGARPVWTVEQTARFTTADALKEMVEESAPKLGASMWSDMLNAALSEVDWHEVADAFLED